MQKGLSEGKPARSPRVVVKPVEERCPLGHGGVCSPLGQGIALVVASLGCSSSDLGRGAGQDVLLSLRLVGKHMVRKGDVDVSSLLGWVKTGLYRIQEGLLITSDRTEGSGFN